MSHHRHRQSGLSKAKKMAESELLVTPENCSKLIGKRVILILPKQEEEETTIGTKEKLRMDEGDSKAEETKPINNGKLKMNWLMFSFFWSL